MMGDLLQRGLTGLYRGAAEMGDPQSAQGGWMRDPYSGRPILAPQFASRMGTVQPAAVQPGDVAGGMAVGLLRSPETLEMLTNEVGAWRPKPTGRYPVTYRRGHAPEDLPRMMSSRGRVTQQGILKSALQKREAELAQLQRPRSAMVGPDPPEVSAGTVERRMQQAIDAVAGPAVDRAPRLVPIETVEKAYLRAGGTPEEFRGALQARPQALRRHSATVKIPGVDRPQGYTVDPDSPAGIVHYVEAPGLREGDEMRVLPQVGSGLQKAPHLGFTAQPRAKLPRGGGSKE